MPTSQPSQQHALTRSTSPVGSISDIKLGHIVAGIGRYRPVFAVVGAILALALILEGPEVVDQTDRFAGSNQAGNLQGSQSASPTTTTPPETGPDTFSAPSPLGGADTASPPPRRPPPSESATRSPSSSYSPPPASSTDGGSTGGSQSFDDEDEELTIAAAAWASRTGGTPLGGTGVPDGSLPVGTRLGQDDKRSFIRLSGDASTLTLFPVEGEDGHRSPEEAVIRMCQITEGGWEEAEGMSFGDAPPYDEEDCVAGVRNDDDGSWAFNLFLYPNATDNRGFAIVPGADAPLDFQVAFAR